MGDPDDEAGGAGDRPQKEEKGASPTAGDNGNTDAALPQPGDETGTDAPLPSAATGDAAPPPAAPPPTAMPTNSRPPRQPLRAA